ncbi:MAG TPA: hypothetical protein DDX71_01515 [Ruminococcus sp.]|nr:hypothetical protein [Ruminococcus sp.]
MNYYVDIHADILPGFSVPGSRPMTTEEAAARTDLLRESNVKLAAAAPYYDPQRYSPEEFLEMRNAKIAALEDHAQSMRIVGGAVLPMEYCMAAPRALAPMVLGESGYLLIELPREPITEEFCEKLSRLRIVSGFSLIAADADRYFDIWTPEDWITLRQTGILLQISVGGILQAEHRKLSLYLLANQYAHFVASGTRPAGEPLRFTESMRTVQRSLPAHLYRRIKNNAGMLLSNAEPSSFF